jgi:transcriptional regulator with XRE-family HTH domain
MARGTAGRPQEGAKDGPSYALAVWLNKNLDLLTDKTNDEIASAMGYERPNIISMWRTGRTRIPLDRVPQIAKLLGVDLAMLLPMWLEQYVQGEQDELTKMFRRLCSEDEAALIKAIRKARGDTKGPISKAERDAIVHCLRGL